MNKVILLGRLVADPELRYTTGQNAVATARFRVAVNRPFKNADGKSEADFIQCIAWRDKAEFVQKYFHKGDMICIDGAIRTGSYTNKDGATVYTFDVQVERVEFGGSKSQNSNDGASTNSMDFMNVPDTNGEDSLPFD